MKRAFIVLWTVLLLFGVAAAFMVRGSLPALDFSPGVMDTMAVFPQTHESAVNEDTPYKWDKNISFADMLAKTEVAALVTCESDERIIKQDCIRSKVSVEEVFKGEANQAIYIYEWATLSQYGGITTYMPLDSYNIMEPGKRYLVFLQFDKQPDGYEYDSIDANTYVFAHVTYGKINMELNNNMKVTDFFETPILYEGIKSWDIIPENREVLNHYKLLRDRALKEFGLH
jgi:hypothetical protein